jgi:DNA-binding winged helix-turn-helix (wHTH) protein
MGTETTPRPHKKEDEIVGLQFGPFELDLKSGELRRAGGLLKLQPQPFKVLALLAGHAGELVTREEIQHEVWPAGTFVDFEQSLNFCIRQIRSVLGDSALTPRYIETLPRRGYRWIGGPVERIGASPAVLEWRRPAAVARLAPFLEPGQPDVEMEGAGVRPRPARWFLGSLAIAAGLAVLATSVYFAFVRRGSALTPVFQRITFRRGLIEAARFGPDGQVVFSAAWEGDPSAFFLSRLETRESQRLNIPSSRLVGVSRQGEVAYLKDSTLARAPLNGGPPREVLADVMAADWTPDGTDFLVARGSRGRGKIEFPIGTVLGEAMLGANPMARIAPDRKHVAFLEHPVWGDDRGSVAVMDRQGRKRTLSDGWASIEGLAWGPKSDEVWFTATRVGADSALHAVSLDGRARTVIPAMGRFVLRDIAADGRVLIERTALRHEIRAGRLGEAEERDLSWLDLSTAEDISVDGQTVLFMESGEGGGPDYTMFLRQTDGALPVRLGTGRGMALSRDGRSVLSVPIRDRSRIDIVPTGAGETRTIRNQGLVEYGWAGFVPPDGKAIYFTARDKTDQHRTYLQDLAGGAPRPLPFMLGASNTWSPDGQAAVFACKADRTEGLCLHSVDGGEPRPLTGVSKSAWAVGFDDTGRLYLAERVEKGEKAPFTRITRMDLKTGRSEPWRDLAPPDRAGVKGLYKILVARNGLSYAYSYARNLADLYVVTNAH